MIGFWEEADEVVDMTIVRIQLVLKLYSSGD